jgi:hypothetical protein
MPWPMTMNKGALLLPFSAALALSGALSGCAGGEAYPSLARRPAELELQGVAAAPTAAPRIGGSAAPAPAGSGATATQQAVSSEVGIRLVQLQQAASAAHDRFLGARARADSLTAAARGLKAGSEDWSVATVAVADLESARSDAMVSLGELDRLYAEERVNGGDGEAIAAVRDKVTAWVADEDAVLADLAGRMKG